MSGSSEILHKRQGCVLQISFFTTTIPDIMVSTWIMTNDGETISVSSNVSAELLNLPTGKC